MVESSIRQPLLVALIALAIIGVGLFSLKRLPVDAYPDAVRVLVQLTPLYQGVDLIRSLTVGAISPSLLLNVGYLTLMGIVGLAVTSQRLDKLLLK